MTAKKCTKKRDARAKLLFWLLNLLLLWSSRCRRRRRILRSLRSLVERAGARASITGTRERQDEAGREKHKSLGFVCSPSFFSLPAASRLSRVGWVLRPCALSSLYYPWGKWGTTRSLKRLVRPFHLSCVNVQRAFILHGRENLISLMGFRCQIERH